MHFARDEVTVSVPASSANLGPGFDALGIALELRDEVWVRATTGPTRVTVEGEGAGKVDTGEGNLVVQSVRAGLESVGAPQIGIEMHCVNRVPHGRGLGSSSAAIVAGLAAAGALLEEGVLDTQGIFQLACQMEGHPDNAAPAVFGGAVVGWIDDGVAYAQPFAVHSKVEITVLIPDLKLETAKARGLLPSKVPHRDAAFNVGRAALLPLALSAHPEWLFAATADRLHQEYRREGMPASLELVDMLRGGGLPAAISGAGPTVIVFSRLDSQTLEDLKKLGWQARQLPLAARGVYTAET